MAPTRLMKGLGYGQGYKYAHDFEGAQVDHVLAALGRVERHRRRELECHPVVGLQRRTGSEPRGRRICPEEHREQPERLRRPERPQVRRHAGRRPAARQLLDARVPQVTAGERFYITNQGFDPATPEFVLTARTGSVAVPVITQLDTDLRIIWVGKLQPGQELTLRHEQLPLVDGRPVAAPVVVVNPYTYGAADDYEKDSVFWLEKTVKGVRQTQGARFSVLERNNLGLRLSRPDPSPATMYGGAFAAAGGKLDATSSAAAITELQTDLAAIGYSLHPTGTYDKHTRAAVRQLVLHFVKHARARALSAREAAGREVSQDTARDIKKCLTW